MGPPARRLAAEWIVVPHREQVSPVPTRQSGFTLIELMVVIVIIGILAVLALPHFTSSMDRAKVTSVKVNARTVVTMLAIYSTDNQALYPNNVAGLRQEAETGNYWKTIRNPFDANQPAIVDFAGTFAVPGAVGYELPSGQKLRFYLYGSDGKMRRIRTNGADFMLTNG